MRDSASPITAYGALFGLGGGTDKRPYAARGLTELRDDVVGPHQEPATGERIERGQLLQSAPRVGPPALDRIAQLERIQDPRTSPGEGRSHRGEVAEVGGG